MKAIIITIVIGLSSLQASAQDTQTINLKWKIGKDEKLNYATVMNVIDTASIAMNFGGLSKALSDSTKKGADESKDLFKKLNQAFKNQDYLTTLSNKGKGIIDIVMRMKPKDTTKKNNNDTTGPDLMEMMRSMNNGIVLRGSVYETGGIHSFWVKGNQKNLLAMFFELPSKPVKIGDKWPLEVNLIGNDQNFACDSSYKINEVMLTDIKQINGETIAVLKYNMAEYVKGDFNSVGLLGGDDKGKKTMMKFIHQGIAEFSVDKGRWLSYDGIMSLEATGVMTANTKTKFTLINTSK
jgi:ABC-type uncharacterized transport system substrate-binding protein